MPHGFALRPCTWRKNDPRKIRIVFFFVFLFLNAWICQHYKKVYCAERKCTLVLKKERESKIKKKRNKTKCKPLKIRLLCSLIYCYFMISFRENKSWGITAILHGVWKFPKVLKDGENFDRNSSPLKTKTILGSDDSNKPKSATINVMQKSFFVLFCFCFLFCFPF